MSAISNNLSDIIIRNEEDAYLVLQQAFDNKLPAFNNLVFDGWPTLDMYVKGEKFQQSITPTIMRGLLEFQKAIYQSFATAKYDNSTKRLSEEEKNDLEIKVDVKDGSSQYEINFQELALKMVEQLAPKMEPIHIVTVVISIAVLYFGSSSLKSYLENRKDTRLRESSDEVQRATLETLKFASAQETERMKLMTAVSNNNLQIKTIANLAYDAKTELVKSLTTGDSSSLYGVRLDPELAQTLTKNARRSTSEVRLDGTYKLLKLDWTDPLKFKVKVLNIKTNFELDAEVQDESLTGTYKETLRLAEWSRQPVVLEINAKKIGDASYREAVIVSVKPI